MAGVRRRVRSAHRARAGCPALRMELRSPASRSLRAGGVHRAARAVALWAPCGHRCRRSHGRDEPQARQGVRRCVAEIDPPLLAGVRMHSSDLASLLGYGPIHAMGTPEIDRNFITRAYDRGRAGLALAQLGSELLEASNRWPLVVCDGNVEVLAEGDAPAAPHGPSSLPSTRAPDFARDTSLTTLGRGFFRVGFGAGSSK